jgi:hypothetical protein
MPLTDKLLALSSVELFWAVLPRAYKLTFWLLCDVIPLCEPVIVWPLMPKLTPFEFENRTVPVLMLFVPS